MTERLAGIQVQETAGSGQSIAEAPTAVTAFVGRCLRGPVNRPVAISGFNEFQRIFDEDYRVHGSGTRPNRSNRGCRSPAAFWAAKLSFTPAQ